jgi:hypothetical protein
LGAEGVDAQIEQLIRLEILFDLGAKPLLQDPDLRVIHAQQAPILDEQNKALDDISGRANQLRIAFRRRLWLVFHAGLARL